ncbi:MAG TPA: nitroreductase/quinone reductase family protein [Longilinea sp.]|nr:nitroreductase/quinone reductase family protein [Longilinea sp.]
MTDQEDWGTPAKNMAGPVMAYRRGLGPLIGRMILLLTTTGRKSGLKRLTPLQYEKIGDDFCVGAGYGPKSDWYRNVLANPHVHVRVKKLSFDAVAEPVTDPSRIADFLAYRLKRHPLMIGLMLRKDGLPMRPSRSQLEEYAGRVPMLVIHPIRNDTQ